MLLVLLAAWGYAVFTLVLRPTQQAPRHADAVVVLSGDHLRLGTALGLMTRGASRTLVISDGRAHGWHRANRLCRGGARFRVLCFRPKPYSTRGEARAVAQLAAAHRWRSVLVVTSTYHVSRARMLFERCYHGRLSVTGSVYPRSVLPLEMVLEPAKLAYERLFTRGC